MEWFKRFYGQDYFKYRYEPRLAEVPAEEVDFVIEQGRLDFAGGRALKVFDICCGVGRHARPLAARGCHVVGVDLAEANIEAAKDLAKEQDIADRCEFHHADIRDFAPPVECDLAINMFTSFGYFENDQADAVIIAKAAQSLRPGGRFILDIANREAVICGFRPRQRRGRRGNYVIEEARLDLERGRLTGTWTFIRDGQRSQHDVSIRLYALHELVAMVEAQGLQLAGAFGDYASTPYDQTSPRCIVVAEK
jgi:SAM-dependent methyltransferase